MKYDVFISYRRDGGEYTAKILHDKLTELGYNVFFDVESLRSGQFNTKLFSVIDECEDFIAVLSPNSLDRCSNENDWVRLEIAHALKKGKNVVPVLLRGFQFPEELPEDIDQLRYRSGIEASTELFDAFAKRLIEFLKTKPKMVHRITQNTLFRKVLPLVIAFFVVFVVIFSGYKVYQTTQASFPYTKADKNTVKELLYYVQSNFSQADLTIRQYDNALTSFQTFLDNQTDSNFNDLKSTLVNSKQEIIETKGKYTALSDALSAKLDNTILPKGDIVALKDFLITCTDDMLDNIETMTSYASGETVLSTTSMSKMIDYYDQISDIDKDIIFYGVNAIFVDVEEDALKDFKSKVLPTLIAIYDGQEWYTDKDEIENITNTDFEKYKVILMDIASVTGDLNLQLDDMEGKVNELESDTEKLDALKASAKEKFKPLETDEPDLLWGKMLRFNTLKMYDMCIECLEMYHSKDTSEEADVFVPITEEFFHNIGSTGIDYGCLVCGYEPDKPQNSFYLLGDILIEMNGKQIKTIDDISAAKVETENTMVKVLRYNGTGFDIAVGEIPVGDSRVLLYDLCEVIE